MAKSEMVGAASVIHAHVAIWPASPDVLPLGAKMAVWNFKADRNLNSRL